MIIADQSAFKQSTKLHSIVLAAEHDSSMKKMLAAATGSELREAAIFTPKMSGLPQMGCKLGWSSLQRDIAKL
ncbi:MAG: hypothetical protein IPN18_16330 [Ignavibacteriales bacterium]|nr:hypothetical protein [Ignavibacteriales bacterium]